MKMKLNLSVCLATALPFLTSVSGFGQSYKMNQVNIQSRWAKEVSPSNALKEYPRPQLMRANWKNLNGLWDYAITVKDAVKPTGFDGQILVPYPLESALSGVKKPYCQHKTFGIKERLIHLCLKLENV
jgi:hypothetical protein